MFFRPRRAPHRGTRFRQAGRRSPPLDGALQGVGRSDARVSLVELRAVEVGYHGTAVLPPLTLSIAAGHSLGIVGPNGSGKTTLVRTLLGLLRPIGGSIVFPEQRPR